MTFKHARRSIFIALLIVVVGACRRESATSVEPAPSTAPSIPSVVVRFGMLPYGDHTYAIIGVEKGWFREVGIDLQHRTIKVEDAVPFVRNGSLDVVSCSPGLIAPAFETNPGVVNFVFGDIFQGFAIMARPDKQYKSVADFVASGMTREAAIAAAAQQLRGKVFAYPAEAAIKPFIDLVLSKGGLRRTDIVSRVMDDPLTVNAMRAGQAEFQVGGAPSHIVLAREGFKPILSAADLAAAARPSADSAELASIFPDGWGCTREYYDRNKATVLRLASVNFRIIKFMNTSQQEALNIHMPFLSQVTGQTFTAAEGRVIYTSLDPFFTFEAQRPWFHDQSNPYYYRHLTGAIINSFVKQKAFTKAVPKIDDIAVAHEVYFELERLKGETERLFRQLDAAGSRQSDLALKAQKFYDAYNYYDAEAFARAALGRGQK